ncbi:hypothetical protein DPMN_148985 [Dreissena polymorpha]|uniref:Fibronectin type-III domain-containing protein n=1 Tax=Dreissena polymorpha TaxID=45954 RepID=A0A9D4FF38_DREPO|nr:hypothetical protein DPMN_148985 [Dreissena polymorpha]
MSLNLQSSFPRLYCITLEVKDVADNVRQARRFVLYDNSSFIETWKEKHFRFDSASAASNFLWQTHYSDICLSLNDFFINRFYLNNNLLNPIDPDPNVLMSGIYEQTHDPLSVNGTPNVHGIIKYYVSWKLNNYSFTTERLIPNFKYQSFCTKLNVTDGQTYTFNIRSVDIVNNTYTESRSLHIDRSPPFIFNMTLKKGSAVFVHNSTDLSKMQMTFDALDLHSGLRTIKWVFGLVDASTELSQGYLAVGQTQNVRF